MWQPIETAPRDGTPILVYSPGHDQSDPTNIIVAKFEDYEGETWWAFCENVLADIAGQVDPEPTHWMPLPEPPK